MLQISSFPIAPPSLLLLCMYPLPLRSNDRASFPRFASETAIFRRPVVTSHSIRYTFVPHNRTAQPLLKLCPCRTLPCYALAYHFTALLCPCHFSLCFARVSFPRFASETANNLLLFLASHSIRYTFARHNQEEIPLLKLCLRFSSASLFIPMRLIAVAMLCPAMPSPCYAVPFLALPLPR